MAPNRKTCCFKGHGHETWKWLGWNQFWLCHYQPIFWSFSPLSSFWQLWRGVTWKTTLHLLPSVSMAVHERDKRVLQWKNNGIETRQLTKNTMQLKKKTAFSTNKNRVGIDPYSYTAQASNARQTNDKTESTEAGRFPGGFERAVTCFRCQRPE